MSPLVDPADLRRMLADVTVLDVRWRLGRDDGHAAYLAGHVPGAVYVDLPTELSDPPSRPPDDRGRHPLPDPERFAAAMRRCGVRRDRPVVVYDDWAGVAAARAWWLLRDHGHPDVRLLDGGWDWWCRSEGPVETGECRPAPGDLSADPGHLAVVDAEGAASVARTGVLLDARARERFRGEAEPVDPRPGHVPGAVNAPTSENLHESRFRPHAELAAAYRQVLEAPGDTPVAVYCGSGVSAAHDVLALQLLGRDAALYHGSWSGWLSDPARPVETGDDTVTKT